MTKRIRPPGYPTPWQRIAEGYDKGVGIRLSWDELERLNQDEAIITRAMLDEEDEEGHYDPDHEPAER